MKLEFQNVTLSYGGRPVLENVTLTVDGGITVLLGRNGAGKSSLLRCLTGEKQDYEGCILLNGARVRTMQPRERARLVGYLPQELPQPRVTVWELVAFGRNPHLPLTGRCTEEDRKAVETALALTDMTAFSNRLVDSLSGGERQKAFLAMALAQETPLLVLDEPTAQLDAAARLAFCKLLKKLCSQTGRSILVVMHELPEALCLADRLAVLQDGLLAFTGTPQEALTQSVPQSCFGITLTGDPINGYAIKPQ